jgi:histidinol-phosphate/aromatic aminotransferase/cobyric acid decarboxylase-like protein
VSAVDLPAWAAAIQGLRRDLERLLRDAGLDPQPSDANWLLVHAPGLRQGLAAHLVLVRDCAGFGMPGTERIAVPDDHGRARLARALEHS